MANKSKPIFNNLIQVGIVVRNLEKVMNSYIQFGIGPFYVLKFSPDNVEEMYVHGKRKN